MWTIEKEGKDPEKLIEEICKQLGKSREELEFEIEEKEGLFGVLGKKVIVRARPKPVQEWELVLLAEELADKIFLYIAPTVRVRARSDRGRIIIGLSGDEIATLRRRKELFDSIVYLIELALSKKAKTKRQVKLELPRSVSRETSSTG
jgi:predicted RNA-binding protein Jag